MATSAIVLKLNFASAIPALDAFKNLITDTPRPSASSETSYIILANDRLGLILNCKLRVWRIILLVLESFISEHSFKIHVWFLFPVFPLHHSCTKLIIPTHQLRSTSHSSEIPLTQLSIMAIFLTVAHSILCNKLPGTLRPRSQLSMFEAHLARLPDVLLLTNLTQANVGLDEAFEHRVQFWFMTGSSLHSQFGILGIQPRQLLPHFRARPC